MPYKSVSPSRSHPEKFIPPPPSRRIWHLLWQKTTPFIFPKKKPNPSPTGKIGFGLYWFVCVRTSALCIPLIDVLQRCTNCGNYKCRKRAILPLNCFFHGFHHIAWKADCFVYSRWCGRNLKAAHTSYLAIHLYCI